MMALIETRLTFKDLIGWQYKEWGRGVEGARNADRCQFDSQQGQTKSQKMSHMWTPLGATSLCSAV